MQTIITGVLQVRQPEEEGLRKHTPSAMNKTGKLLTMDKEKAEELNTFFCLSLHW